MIRRWIKSLGLSTALIAGATTAVAQDPTFELTGVEFTETIYLTDEELQATIVPYMNRPITFDDVQAMLDDVRRLYTASGVVTADVLLLPQDVTNGILKLDLVEAAIGEVNIVDVTRTDLSFVRDRISLTPGERPDYTAIQQDMRIFELAYDVRPQLSFSPGSEFGLSNVDVSLNEPEVRDWTLSIDNFAAESLGRWQATLSGRWHSLTGYRDTLSYSLGWGEGLQEIALGYARPVGRNGAKVTGDLDFSRTEVVDGTYAVLDVVTERSRIALGYEALAFVDQESYWRFGGDLSYTATRSTLLDVELQDRTQWEVVLSATHNRSLFDGTLNATVGLTYGESDTGGVAATDGEFQLLTTNLQYARAIGSNWIGEASLRGQFTDQDTLPASKLFTVGGLSSLRGYPDGVLSGLAGLDLRLQVSRRPEQVGAFEGDLTWAPFAFIDAATLEPVPEDADRIDVYSAGFGVRGGYGENTSFLATVASPLKDVEGQDIPDGPEFYVGLDYQF